MPRERLCASMTVKNFEDKSVDEFRDNFHRLLRICTNHRKLTERRNLLILLFAYHQIERDEPLLNLEYMTDDEKMNIRECHTRVLDALFDEEAMVGSKDIRSVVAGYTLYRTDIHPVAQHILGTAMGNSNVFYIGRYLLAELRVRYWAFGPEFDKRLIAGRARFGGCRPGRMVVRQSCTHSNRSE
uniref:Uncharacterized protein n=1 Tax=Pristionchus pacificus TaxID=54126 RepID=A0A8R1Y558_PRIPA